MRADTIAACASALAAIAAAFVAAYSLVFIARQEETARNQLQATYLSNLYSKQVDTFVSFQNSLSDRNFSDMEAQWILIVVDLGRPLDPKGYQLLLRARVDNLEKAIPLIRANVGAMKLIFPNPYNNLVGEVIDAYNSLYVETLKFTDKDTSPTRKQLDEFAVIAKPAIYKSQSLQEKLFACTREILSTGRPITIETVEGCRSDYKN